MRHCASQPRPGFSMMEIAVSIAVTGLLLGMMGVVLWATVRIEKAEAASFQRDMSLSLLADRFRSDVNLAETSPEAMGDFKASERCLILKRPDGTSVVYRWDNGRLERREKTADKEEQAFLTIPEQIDDIAFRHVEANKGLLEMTVRPAQEQRSIPRNPAAVIQAALGGGLR